MPRRKPKITPLKSANYTVMIERVTQIDLVTGATYVAGTRGWYVIDRNTHANTEEFSDWEEYYTLKRIWRRSKLDFDSRCSFMQFKDLFSTAGVKL